MVWAVITNMSFKTTTNDHRDPSPAYLQRYSPVTELLLQTWFREIQTAFGSLGEDLFWTMLTTQLLYYLATQKHHRKFTFHAQPQLACAYIILLPNRQQCSHPSQLTPPPTTHTHTIITSTFVILWRPRIFFNNTCFLSILTDMFHPPLSYFSFTRSIYLARHQRNWSWLKFDKYSN